jgi:hypothetical protein
MAAYGEDLAYIHDQGYGELAEGAAASARADPSPPT